jgi:cell wall-associated NlpC family hydrolase
MRVVPALLAVALVACSSAQRGPSASSLTARARAGREPPATETGRAVVAFAAARVGARYCWGGTGPGCFDCSGLVQEAWASVGVRLPRTSSNMAAELPQVPFEDIRAGDILWWPGHVGIYAGGGWMIDALDSRDGVVRRPAQSPHRALRPRG